MGEISPDPGKVYMTEDAHTEHELNEVLTDLGDKPEAELKQILDELYAEESRLSYRRRILHGRIDIVRNELVARMKKSVHEGKLSFGPEDIARLSEILAREGTVSNAFRDINPDELSDESVFK